jgi:arylsulfatase A-like enzyme
LDETVFIVTSDNGYMWGEHGFWGKNFAYEESIRVPLLVVMPGIAPRVDSHLVSAVLDLGPTLYDIAGIPSNSDGRSLLPLLENPGTPWRQELFFEKYGTTSWVNALWAGLRRGNWKYVRYWNDDEELYDLATDPYELENRAGDPALAGVRDDLANRVEQQLGLSIKPANFYRAGQLGQWYSYDFDTFGGDPPFTWEIETGAAPPGLILNPATGVLSGTPTQRGSWTFTVRVTDSHIASQSGELRTFVSGAVNININ